MASGCEFESSGVTVTVRKFIAGYNIYKNYLSFVVSVLMLHVCVDASVLHTSARMCVFCLHGGTWPSPSNFMHRTCISLCLSCSWVTLLIYSSFLLLPLTIASYIDVLFNHQLQDAGKGYMCNSWWCIWLWWYSLCLVHISGQRKKKIGIFSLYYYNGCSYTPSIDIHQFHTCRYTSLP